jgi:C-terminal processing protease CtpA/Prc
MVLGVLAPRSAIWKLPRNGLGEVWKDHLLQPYCNGHVQFAMLRNAIGYLRVTTFYDYTEGGYANQLHGLQQSLETMFGGAEKLKGLVIDMRLNNGGDDPPGIEIASRLTGRKYLAYTKAARRNTGLDLSIQLTEQQSTWVVPNARPKFKGRVALLIGPDTVSAGETFAMALTGRKPRVR